jgi:hypothetical protein
MDNTTLLEALQGGGGSGLSGAAEILMRAATSALLNAAHPNVDYPRTVAQVIADVNAALATKNRDKMLKLATKLDHDNNLDCPLNGGGKCKYNHKCNNHHKGRKGNKGNHGHNGHNYKGENAPSSNLAEQAIELRIKALPNPSYGVFNLQIESGSSENITMRIMDMQGRLIEQFLNVRQSQQLRIGEKYKAGVYFIELIQGSERKQMKLVKIR